MKRKSLTYLLFLAAAVMSALASCTETEYETNVISKKDLAIVSINIAGDSYGNAITKSSFSWQDEEINDIELVVTDADGNIEEVIYSRTSSSLTFEGIVGRTYFIWGAANLGRKEEAVTLSGFVDKVRTVSRSQIEDYGIPMFSASSTGKPGPVEITVTGTYDKVTVHMVRMMARIDFKVDKSYLDTPDGFSIDGITLYNAIDSYLPFADENKQAHERKYGNALDKASVKDLIDANQEKAVTLYAFENMQGNLLAGNNDPWKKVPSGIGDAEGCCSYIEMECSYVSGSLACNDIKYRMYLGEDSTTNFDVRRNTKYTITLFPSEGEVDGHRGSWKIESSGWNDPGGYEPEVEYELIIEPATAVIAPGETLQYAVSENRYEDGVLVKTWDDISAVCNWSTDDTSIATVSSRGLAYGKSDGAVIVTASYREDNGVTYYGTAELIVETPAPPVPYIVAYELVVEPDGENCPQTIGEGESASFSAILYEVYSDGTADDGTDVTESERTSWNTDTEDYIRAAGNGVYNWSAGPGATSVTAAYELASGNSIGSENYGIIITEAHVPVISHALVVTPSSQTIDFEETAYCTATYFTYTDGITDGGVNVTEIASWSIVSGSSVNNDGDGVFSWRSEGDAIVKAVYDGCSDSAIISCCAEPVPPATTLESIAVSDDCLVLDYYNGWGDFFTVTAFFSDGTSKDVTLEAGYGSSGPVLVKPGSVDATDEGAGNIDVSYTYEGVTKHAAISVECLTGIYWEGVNPEIENAHGNSNEWYFTLYADVFNHYTRMQYTVLLKPGIDYEYWGTGDMEIVEMGESLDIFIKSAGQTLSFSAVDPIWGETFDDEISMIHY